MAETYNGGITLTWPSAGEVDWVAVYRSFARTISDHDHTGGGRGTKISGSALSVDAFTGASFRLDFNEWLRSRNDLNTADVNILRITTANELEVGPPANFTTINADTLNISEIRIDQLYVNVPALSSTIYPANVQNYLDDGVALSLEAPVGRLKFRLAANAVPGSAIRTEYFNNNSLVFTQTVDDNGYVSFIPAAGETIRFTSNALVPINDAAYILGASNKKFLEAHVVNAFISVLDISAINATTQLDLKVNNVLKLTLDSSGNLYPAVDNAQSLGSSGAFFGATYTNKIYGFNFVDIGMYGVGQSTRFDSAGHIFPSTNNFQDLGTTTKKWGTGYFGTSVDTPSITGLTWTVWAYTLAPVGGTGHTVATNNANYIQLGKVVLFQTGGTFTIGSAGPNQFDINTPVTCINTYQTGSCMARRVSTNDYYPGSWELNGTTKIRLSFYNLNAAADNMREFFSTDGQIVYQCSGILQAA